MRGLGFFPRSRRLAATDREFGGHGRPPSISKERQNVRTTLIAASGLALLLVAVAFTNLRAQQAPPANRGGTPSYPNGVAVVDITYILDNYSKLKQAMDNFKFKFEQRNKEFQTEKDNIVKS